MTISESGSHQGWAERVEVMERYRDGSRVWAARETTFLNIEQVRQRTSLSKQEIYRRVRRGDFPKQIQIGPARVAWVETEVDEWAQKILEGRRS